MKRINLSTISLSAIFIFGCNAGEDLNGLDHTSSNSLSAAEQAETEPQVIEIEITYDEPQATTQQPKTEEITLSDNREEEIQIENNSYIIKQGSEPPGFLEYAEGQDPWLVKNSYGTAPTRFASDGPFLFSHEIKFENHPLVEDDDYDLLGKKYEDDDEY